MSNEETYTVLLSQHIQLLQQLNVLWVAFIILVFIQVLGLFVIVGLAAWSVARVNKASIDRIATAEKQWAEHRQQWMVFQQLVAQRLAQVIEIAEKRIGDA